MIKCQGILCALFKETYLTFTKETLNILSKFFLKSFKTSKKARKL